MKVRVKLFLLILILVKTVHLHIFFKLHTFKNIMNKFINLKPMSMTLNPNPFKVARLIRLIIKFLFFSKNCLHRAFITASVLKIIGINVNLIIGVSNIDSFKSHAWIEINGTPILENHSLNTFKIIYKA